MLALYRCGRQAEALEVYRDTRRALVDQLAIEPSRELRELERAILEQDRSLDLVEDVRAGEPRGGDFVGRDRELAVLSQTLEDALAGRGRVILLAGEPGIGKSRLAAELAARARGRGAKVLVGRCWEAGGAPAYWPWVQSLRAYVREAQLDALRAELGAGAADLAQIVPEVRERLPDLPAPPSADSEAARFPLFDLAHPAADGRGAARDAGRARKRSPPFDDLLGAVARRPTGRDGGPGAQPADGLTPRARAWPSRPGAAGQYSFLIWK